MSGKPDHQSATLSLRVPVSTREQIDDLAARLRTTPGHVGRLLIEDALADLRPGWPLPDRAHAA